MNPCMYLILPAPNTTPMSPGKLAAQAAHAAVEAYLLSDQNKQVVNRWRCGGHYAKIVLMADNLEVAERYIKDRGFKTALIIDEGRTEFNGRLTPTAIGVEITDKDDLHVRETFSTFKLYAYSPMLIPREPMATAFSKDSTAVRPTPTAVFYDSPPKEQTFWDRLRGRKRKLDF